MDYNFSREEMIKLLSAGGCEGCPKEKLCDKHECQMEKQAAELLISDVDFIHEQTEAIAILLSQTDDEADETEADPEPARVPVRYRKNITYYKACPEITEKGLKTAAVPFSVTLVGETAYTMDEFIRKRVPAGLPCDVYTHCFMCDKINLLEEKPFYVTVDNVGDRFICPRCAHKYFK